MMSIGWPLGTNVCSKQRNANTNTNQNHVLINCAWNRMVHARRTLKGSVRMPKNKRFAEKQELAITTRLFFDMHWQQFTHNWNLCAFWNTFQWHWPAQVAKPGTSSVILLLRMNLQVTSELGNTLLSQKVDQDPGPNYQDLPAFSGKLLSPWQEACPCSSTALRWVLADWRHLTSVLVMNKILNLIPRLAPFG